MAGKMKKSKKTGAVLAAVILSLVLAACGGKAETPSAAEEEKTAVSKEEAAEATQDAQEEAQPATDAAAASAPETEFPVPETASEGVTAAAEEVSGTGESGSETGAEGSGIGGTDGEAGALTADEVNYLVLVNKLNPLPDGWEEIIETVHMTNTVGDDVEVEKKAYDAYLLLKEDLEKEGVYVDLDSSRRSVAEQQRIMDDFTEKYGADYAAKTVATPGYSEHHTGLALDLYLIIDGKDVVENEDMIQYPEIWEKIHEKLADYGFILRYLKGKEQITGYGYEPWHIRYVDSADIAKDIMSSGLTLEEYLGAVKGTEVSIDYGTSSVFTPEELEEAAVQIKCMFASWKGCEMHSLRYAGDENNTQENLDWLNSLGEGGDYVKAAEFLCDFHSPVEQYGAWEADKEYTDYQWWLGKTKDGSWEIVTWGY